MTGESLGQRALDRLDAAMDALVGSLNSQKTGLKTTFDNMSAMYSNK